jgi:hypothetical protein
MSTYELALKCSNLFNLLDARGAISVTERVGMIGRIRNLAVGVAKAYAAQQAAQLALSCQLSVSGAHDSILRPNSNNLTNRCAALSSCKRKRSVRKNCG